VRLAYQGEPGAYSEAAALQFGGPDAETLPCKSFDEVFEAVVKKRATHGVVPLENSIGGTIHRNYDLLLEHDLSVTGEVELDVVHCLQALPGTKLADVKTVYSHPQALAQCERYLKDLGVQVEAVYDTAGGAKLVSEQKLVNAAALASRRAADVFGLEVLQEAVQDYEFNITRFAIIGGTPPQDANKTTIVFALRSTPGSLFKALSVFALRDINLTKLESRPIRGAPWEYLFYVEVEANRDDLHLRPRPDAPGRVREGGPGCWGATGRGEKVDRRTGGVHETRCRSALRSHEEHDTLRHRGTEVKTVLI
jgi:prephenate dehydratase